MLLGLVGCADSFADTNWKDSSGRVDMTLEATGEATLVAEDADGFTEWSGEWIETDAGVNVALRCDRAWNEGPVPEGEEKKCPSKGAYLACDQTPTEVLVCDTGMSTITFHQRMASEDAAVASE
jgi:hypothetical protein